MSLTTLKHNVFICLLFYLSNQHLLFILLLFLLLYSYFPPPNLLPVCLQCPLKRSLFLILFIGGHQEWWPWSDSNLTCSKGWWLLRHDIIIIESKLPKVLSTLESTSRGEFYYRYVMKFSGLFLWGLDSGGHSYYSTTQVVYMSLWLGI